MAEKFIWSHLLHLGSNLWREEGNYKGREHRSTPCASPVLRYFPELWDKHLENLAEIGVNTIILDLAEAMRYESHPELAVEGSFDHDRMKKEIDKMHALGFEIVPKLNFSACHDVWLKDYSRMLSTPIYYQVCKDLIDEVCEVFKPKHFHIGMDEETAANQRKLWYCVIRQGDLWWHDLHYLVDCVERHNARAWVWGDGMWGNEEEYLSKMPKTVIQNNWYYSARLEDGNEHELARLRGFELLDQKGYDQVPAGSTWGAYENFEKLTKYSVEHISEEHLLGMMQTTWERVDPDWMQTHKNAEETIKAAKAWYDNRK